MGLGLLTLLRHPAQLRHLQRDPTLMDQTIVEILRYDSSVQAVSRTALADLHLGNQRIHQGQILHGLIAAANRDPDRFPQPDQFDIQRPVQSHLAFGQGMHACIGLHLAKLVAGIAIGTIVRRLPQLSLTPDPCLWEDTFLLRGLKTLPVTFEPVRPSSDQT